MVSEFVGFNLAEADDIELKQIENVLSACDHLHVGEDPSEDEPFVHFAQNVEEDLALELHNLLQHQITNLTVRK